MKAALVTVLVALVCACPAHARPNVILIVTDDQRWDTLGYMPTVSSELVDKGVTFTNAFAVNPLCCPSRASIFTGQWSHTHGVWANGPRGYVNFRDGSTLATWLDAAGYETMLVGKYINGFWPPFAEASYVPPGWDRWFANWLHPQLYFGYHITTGTEVLTFGSEAEAYMTDVLGLEAVRFVRETEDPFFLYLAPKAPHVTRAGFSTDPAPRHIDAFDGLGALATPSVNEPDVADKPRHIRRLSPIPTESLAELREEQLEALLAVDEAVAGILTALEETGKLDDTLLIFTSDNGHGWGEHRWVKKSVPYEESLRVPLVARWDALGTGVRTEQRFALNVDLAPTIAAAVGVDAPAAEGHSLLPLMAAEPVRWRQQVLLEHSSAPRSVPGYCGFRGDRWKYVQYATGEEELYDLLRDPFELRNVVLGNHRPLTMAYRKRVRRSACRPPGYEPLPLCTTQGTDRGDFIRGTPHRDWICAGGGPDRIDVGGGRVDVVRCGRGFDRVRADRRDRLIGCERRSRKRIP